MKIKDLYSVLMGIYTKDRYQVVYDVKNGIKTVDEFKTDVKDFCKEYYATEDEENINQVANELANNLFGYSILTEYINDKEITDIKVHRWNNIILKRNGKKYKAEKVFDSVDQYNRFIGTVTVRNKINASNVNAISRFTDDSSIDDVILRFTLITPLLTTDANYELIIRKVPKDFSLLDELCEKKKMMPPEVCEYVKESWKRGSVLICGANSSGKTTLLNALKEEIPHDKSVLVAQQAEELTTHTHPDMIFLHTFEGRGDSEVAYNLLDLSIAGLTMDIEYFIIGEIKGAEASALLNASYTGHICGATIHANSSSTALDKLTDYALMGSKYTKEEFMKMLTTFKTVIFMKDFEVAEISEVMAYENGEIKYRPIYRA